MPELKRRFRDTAMREIEWDVLELLHNYFGERDAALYRQWHNNVPLKRLQADFQLPESRIHLIVQDVDRRLQSCFAVHRLQAMMELLPLSISGKEARGIAAQMDAAVAKLTALCADTAARDCAQPKRQLSIGTPIDELKVSTRAYNVLYQIHATTVEEICKLTLADLLRIRNCGKRTVAEIERAVAARGLALAAE